MFRASYIAGLLLMIMLLSGCDGGQVVPTATAVAPTAPTATAPAATVPAATVPAAPTATAVAAITTTVAPTGTVAAPTETAAAGGSGRTTLLTNADGSNAAYRAIGQFKGDSSCTATLLKTVEGDAASTAPAYLITNGHCIKQSDSNEVLLDAESQGFTVTFDFFVDTAARQYKVAVKRTPYSTMKGRDLAIVELDTTLGDLVGRGYQPYTLAAMPPLPGTAIRVIGVPVVGFEARDQFLRLASCTSAFKINTLIEGRWHFVDTTRNDCADIKGGSSGSPVLDGDGQIVGLINTTNADSGPGGDCYYGRPCELTESGSQVIEDTNYMVDLSGVAACFGADGRFNRSNQGCPLDDGSQLNLEGFPYGIQQPVVKGQPVRWNTTLSGEYSHYRYKLGPASTTDCRVDAGYGAVTALATSSKIDEPIGDKEGIYALCVVAGRSAQVDDIWQPVGRATAVYARLDSTPPVREPDITDTGKVEGGNYIATFNYHPPEISFYRYKLGPEATTDCSVAEGYVGHRRQPLNIDVSSGPLKLCVIAQDEANNEAKPWERIYK